MVTGSQPASTLRYEKPAQLASRRAAHVPHRLPMTVVLHTRWAREIM